MPLPASAIGTTRPPCTTTVERSRLRLFAKAVGQEDPVYTDVDVRLLVADMLSRVVLAPQVLPVGVVTALAGAPFFIWILRRARSKIFW